ncbi:Mis12 protein-domain-containing protein [Zopfochytrium polystomum]|nr:Mis12 protein-domain-containing protein [Zopfochytrium polystomum]
MSHRSRKLSLLLTAAASRAAASARLSKCIPAINAADDPAARSTAQAQLDHPATASASPSASASSATTAREIGANELKSLLDQHAEPDVPPPDAPSSLPAQMTQQPPGPRQPAVDPVAFALTQKERAKELVVEHFGFVPMEAVDDVINAMNGLMYQTMEAMEEFVEERLGESDDGQDEVEKGMIALETLLENAVDASFDKFEVFVLSNIFKIPDGVYVALPHYEGTKKLDMDIDTARRVDAELDEKILHAKKRLAAAGSFQQMAQKQIQELSRQLECLNVVSRVMSQVLEPTKSPDVRPLPSTMATLAENMEIVRSRSAEATKRSAALPSPAAVFSAYSSRPRAIVNMVGKFLAKSKKRSRSDDDDDDDGRDGSPDDDEAANRRLASVSSSMLPISEDELAFAHQVGGVPSVWKERMIPAVGAVGRT